MSGGRYRTPLRPNRHYRRQLRGWRWPDRAARRHHRTGVLSLARGSSPRSSGLVRPRPGRAGQTGVVDEVGERPAADHQRPGGGPVRGGEQAVIVATGSRPDDGRSTGAMGGTVLDNEEVTADGRSDSGNSRCSAGYAAGIDCESPVRHRLRTTSVRWGRIVKQQRK